MLELRKTEIGEMWTRITTLFNMRASPWRTVRAAQNRSSDTRFDEQRQQQTSNDSE